MGECGDVDHSLGIGLLVGVVLGLALLDYGAQLPPVVNVRLSSRLSVVADEELALFLVNCPYDRSSTVQSNWVRGLVVL